MEPPGQQPRRQPGEEEANDVPLAAERDDREGNDEAAGLGDENEAANNEENDQAEQEDAAAANDDEEENDDNPNNNDPNLSFGSLLHQQWMTLTQLERDWALRIKQVVASTPELSSPPISDFMITQIALVMIEDEEHGNIDKATERLRRFQAIRDNYVIQESVEFGKTIMRQFVEDLFPGFLLSFYYHPSEGRYILVMDMTVFDMSVCRDPEKALIWLQGVYYFNHCQHADLAAIRNGMVYMVECDGYYWKSKNMLQLSAFQGWAELVGGYPLNFSSLMHFHTGLFVNLMSSIGRKALPARIAKKFLFGFGSDHGRLDEIYLQPSLEVANQRLLYQLGLALEWRYKNEAEFRL